MDTSDILLRLKARGDECTDAQDLVESFTEVNGDPDLAVFTREGAQMLTSNVMMAVMGMVGPEEFNEIAHAAMTYAVAAGIGVGQARAAEALDAADDIPDVPDWL